MSEPTQEQQEKFWKRCGFEWDEKYGHWNYPDGSPHSQLPKLTGIEALGNLFKYAVPKLIPDHLFNIELMPQIDGWAVTIKTTVENEYRFDMHYGRGEDPALALCWALREVMNGDTG